MNRPVPMKVLLIAATLMSLCLAGQANAAEKSVYVEREYAEIPPAPRFQSVASADQKSLGCMSCHTTTDSKSMHESPGVILGCTDCHGGDADIFADESQMHDKYLMEKAHVLPSYPEDWHYPHSANPKDSYALLNREAKEFVRFVNPSDLRAAEEACGACHLPIVQAAKRSIMATGAMLFGAATYANGILPFKNYLLGEAYTPDGKPSAIVGPPLENAAEMQKNYGVLRQLVPIPTWETTPPGDIFRVFERGGRNITNLFPETGLPNSLGLLQRIEEPGRPDFRQSNRGPGTGGRISVPVLNVHKTRLNDPLMWFLGTNNNPGDYRTSGCGACHVVYANDRDERHSGPYGKFGHTGLTQTTDPTIKKDEEGHPLKHSFTRSIPTASCMSCHMHQPNMFVNSYLGYTMWDYESDAESMFPAEQKYPTDEEIRESNKNNPEGAAVLGLWSDQEFLRGVSEMNPELKNTQFADYHGHGWNFRAVFKKDRKGYLLDEAGDVVSHDDPKKFDKAVHMSSIHLDVGMHCVDCHFSQDSHGNGHIYGEVANAVEIDCIDCHGTADSYPTLKTRGPAAPPGGTDLSLIRNPDGQLRFSWRDGKLFQRSLLWPDREWQLSLVKDSVNKDHEEYNEKAARSKLMSKNTDTQEWGGDVDIDYRAHSDEDIECYACHQSWTTSCGGCHLPIEANWKTPINHFEGGITRNYATYNPQVVRDQIFMLGRRGGINGGRIAPLRSTSALVLSSTNSNREKIYIQQPPISASGYSSQAINPHFAHTVRKTETRVCSDCHLSESGDNNAIMAQTLGFGTDFIDFVGYHAWVGTSEAVEAVQVTEWSEPQAVIGSHLHSVVYPDYFKAHEEKSKVLETGHRHGSGAVNCLQLRGEYLFAAAGKKGMVAYDVAGIGNKGISQKIITAPFSALGHDTTIESTNATCLSLSTTQPVAPYRNEGELMRETNQEKPFHPIYNYAVITDSVEGVILTDINTLSDGEPRNNFLTRALTWNENNILKGARDIEIGGQYAYIIADAGLVIIDFDKPLEPVHIATVPLNDGRDVFQQFRYLFVTDADGLKTVDITNPTRPALVPDNTIELSDAQRVFVARTYAYVAAGKDGLVIVDITTPTKMQIHERFTDGLQDARDVVIASTNASLYAYVADGTAGLKVVQLMSPVSQPRYYGFSAEPNPELIATYPMKGTAISLSRGLERDRAVDESGGQVAVFSRLGSGPLSREDMHGLYLDKDGKPWFVNDVPGDDAQGQEQGQVQAQKGGGQQGGER